MKIKNTVVLSLTILLIGCGGGGSSSGGEVATSTIKYTGSFRTGLYSGTISIELPTNARPIVELTGVECITAPFSDRMTTELQPGNIRLVAGTITELSVGGRFSTRFPESGGEGEITLGLSVDDGCRGASTGTVSVARI